MALWAAGALCVCVCVRFCACVLSQSHTHMLAESHFPVTPLYLATLLGVIVGFEWMNGYVRKNNVFMILAHRGQREEELFQWEEKVYLSWW